MSQREFQDCRECHTLSRHTRTDGCILAAQDAVDTTEDHTDPSQVILMMLAIAESIGKNIIIGVRPNGTWFAHCDGIEWDGSPQSALQGVLDQLIHRESSTNAKAVADAVTAQNRLDALRAL